MNNPKLSIVILNHDTKDLLFDCLNSLKKVRDELLFEVIVSDNNSSDGSREMVHGQFPWVKLITGPNISYSNGNNRAKDIVRGRYILFLNSDTIVHENALKKSVEYLENNNDVGALSCKLVLPNGKLDRDTRRRFPNPWNSFSRLFLKSGRNYWYLDVDENKTHEVDVIQGAFFLTKKKILDSVNWFDEKYEFDGEDIDLCFQVKKLGYKIVYYPEVSITHIKKATKNKVGGINRKMQGMDSMEYFVRKNLWDRYPLVFNYFVLTGIYLLKFFRFLKSKFI